MRNFFCGVIEQANSFQTGFVTEPFEAGWASEARWFVRILEAAEQGDVGIRATAQISPDGLCWCDHDVLPATLELSASAPEPAMATLRQKEFGNWLRLRVELLGENPDVKLLIYLALKE